MRTVTRLLFLSVVIFFTSCEKEVSLQNLNNSGSNGGTGNTNDITGDYDFAGLVAHTQSTVTVVDAGQEAKSVTVSDYATKDNVGTVTITSNQFISTGLGYSIDTIMDVKTYENGVLLDDSNFPFVTSVPPANSTSPYTRVTADSITVTGALGVAPDPSGNVPTGPVGVKLSWSGDTLLLTTISTFTQSISQGGVPATIVGSVDGVIKLKKH
jgi:hypothetical protein